MLYLACMTLVLAAAPTYPKPELLIEADGLGKLKSALVVDVRGKDRYAESHIPNAIWLDVSAWSKAFAADTAAEPWSTRFGEAGLDLTKTIVIYGDDVRDAARVWWILRYWGFEDVRLLNGGWPAWKEAGGKISSETTKPRRTNATLTAKPDRLATKGHLLNILKDQPPQIIDTRSEKEFCGTDIRAKKGGAIPGAIHLEWSECFDPKTKKFKTPDELGQLFKERQIDVNQPAVTYCQSGGRAAVVAFTLELMGGKQVRNYYRSWSEWGNAEDTPIHKAEPKKR